MSYRDFVKYFDTLEICNLSPDSLDIANNFQWEVATFEGTWASGDTAGGCRWVIIFPNYFRMQVGQNLLQLFQDAGGSESSPTILGCRWVRIFPNYFRMQVGQNLPQLFFLVPRFRVKSGKIIGMSILNQKMLPNN